MGKYKLLELRTNTSDAARLDPKTTTTDADDDEQPVTKRDFKELQASIVWPPVYTCNQDLRRAEEMVQRRDEILLDNTLTSSEKLRRLSEVDRSFILFSKKAEDALGSNYTLAMLKCAVQVMEVTERSLWVVASKPNQTHHPPHHHRHTRDQQRFEPETRTGHAG